MADNENNSGGSAMTVLVTVIIILIIGAAFYFGYAKSHWGSGANNGIDVNLTVPIGSSGGGIAE